MKLHRPIEILLRALLKPVVAYCAKHSLKFQDVGDYLKVEFLEHAKRELSQKGAKITNSRLSMLTGLQRKDIDRLQSGDGNPRESSNIIFRVIGLWRDDAKYLTSAGTPKILSLDPESGEFQKLISQISSDVGPAAVLFELERLKYVERSPRGLKLLVDNFIPRGDIRVDEGADILAEDANDLSKVACDNILHPEKPAQHHLRTEYDKIRSDALSHLRTWFLKEGHAFHLRARAELSKYDQDVNPNPKFKGPTTRVSFSSFSNGEIPEEESDEIVKKKDVI